MVLHASFGIFLAARQQLQSAGARKACFPSVLPPPNTYYVTSMESVKIFLTTTITTTTEVSTSHPAKRHAHIIVSGIPDSGVYHKTTNKAYHQTGNNLVTWLKVVAKITGS